MICFCYLGGYFMFSQRAFRCFSCYWMGVTPFTHLLSTCVYIGASASMTQQLTLKMKWVPSLQICAAPALSPLRDSSKTSIMSIGQRGYKLHSSLKFKFILACMGVKKKKKRGESVQYYYSVRVSSKKFMIDFRFYWQTQQNSVKVQHF